MRNLLLSSQRLNKLEQCPRLFFFENILNKTPIEKPKYFIEGEFVHAILEQYYSSKIAGSPEDNIAIIDFARNKATELSLTVEESEVLIKLFIDYISFHNNESWVIEAAEFPFAKVLFESEEKDIRIIIQGKVDLLATSKEGIPLIIDHKVVSQNRVTYERDNQILLYCWALERNDFIINQLGKQKTLPAKDKFRRQYYNIPSHLLEEWKEGTIWKALELLRYHELNYFPHRYSSCNFQGRKCTFYEVCNGSKENWEYKLEGNFTTKEDYNLMEEKSD
jgi:RecB family exonuclease